MSPTLRRLSRREIDPERWDRAVLADPVPLPYGLSWWLDIVTDSSWDGLVMDDYRVVFPLPDVKRFGLFPAILRPAFTQQLGPFGALTEGDLGRLLSRVPRRFQISLPLRTTVRTTEIPARFTHRRRTNFVLPLDASITELRMAFPRKLQAYLRKTSADVLEPMEASHFIVLVRQQLTGKSGLNDAQFKLLERLIYAVENHQLGGCHQLREDGQLLAASFNPSLGGRTINLAAASTERGKKRRGMSRLLDLQFQAGAGKPGAKFDFEGSELPGVKEYFAKFGGVDEGYYLIEEKGFGLL